MTRLTTADRLRSALARWGVLTALMLASTASFAQSGANHAAADALYAEGRSLLKEGQRAAGCAKFEASLALSPAASTMLNIARCHEQDGKVATAWSDYTRALALNADTVGTERRAELERLAREGMRALTPRVPKLRIVLTAPPPGLQVWSDGNELPRIALGEALPVDPGPHEVRASAPGYLPMTRSVTVEEGKRLELALTLTRDAAPARALAPAPEHRIQGPAVKAPSGGWAMPVGVALTVVGAAGLGLGAATGIVSLNQVSAIRQSCGGLICPADDQKDRQALVSARALGDVSTASLIAGGAFTAAGIALLLFRPGDGHAARAGGVRSAMPLTSVRVSLGIGGLGVEGSF